VVGRLGSTIASGALDATTGQQPTANPSHKAKAEFLKVPPAMTRLRPPYRARYYKHAGIQKFQAAAEWLLPGTES
jgi:hypothetical protein